MLKSKLKAPAGALAVLFLIMQQAAFLLVLSSPVQANSLTTPPLTVELKSLPTSVTGLITLRAQTSQEPDSVRFQIIGPDETYQTFVGQKLNETNYYFDWDTSKFSNGAYRLSVNAIKGAYLAYDEAVVEVANVITTDSEMGSASSSVTRENSSSLDTNAGNFTGEKEGTSSLNNLTNSSSLDSTLPSATTTSSLPSETVATSSAGLDLNKDADLLTQRNDNKIDNSEQVPDSASSSDLISQNLRGILKEQNQEDKDSQDQANQATSSVDKITQQETVVQIVSPTNSSQISREVILLAKSTEPMQAVDFYFQPSKAGGDNVLIGSAESTEQKQEWKLVWQTNKQADGVYILQARAKNQAGQIFYSQPIAVEIFNSWESKTQTKNNKDKSKSTNNDLPASNIQTNQTQSVENKAASQTASSSLSQTLKNVKQPSPASTEQPLKQVSQEIKSIQTRLQADLSTTTAGREVKVKTRVEVKDRFQGEKIVVQECLNRNITDKDECWQFLKKQYGEFLICRGLSASECSSILRSNLILSVQQMVSLERLPHQCLAASINSLVDCETFLRSQFGTQACYSIGLTSQDDCADWLNKKYGLPAKCLSLNKKECQNLIDKVILADFVNPRWRDKAKKELKVIVGKHIAITPFDSSTATATQIIIDTEKPLEAGQEFSRTVSKILPLRAEKEKEIKVTILPLNIKDSETSLGAAIIFDQDGDGLPDDVERRLGTDPAKKDSDGDGYSDKEEIANGYNPVGSGKLTKLLAPIEKAFVLGQKLGEPKQEGQLTTALKILAVKNEPDNSREVETAASSTLYFKGQALPNQVISLYIYSSLPIIITVQADSNGNWVYELDKTLVDGKHEAYVVINNEDGSIAAKSAAFAFFIKGAQAASADEFIQTEAVAPISTASTPAKRMVNTYILAGIGLVLISLVVFLLYYYHQQHHNKQATV